MSAQEREALAVFIREAFDRKADDPDLSNLDTWLYAADVLLAAGWTRPVSDEDVIERAAQEMYHAVGFHAADTWESDMQVRRDHYREQARALHEAGLLVGGAPGRSEAETGWFEFIMPGGSTTHIAYVYEDGSVYLPEGRDVVDEDDWVLAKASSRIWRLIRADQVTDTEGTDHE